MNMITKSNGAGMSLGAVAILLLTVIIYPQIQLLSDTDDEIIQTLNEHGISIALNTEKTVKIADLDEKVNNLNISMGKVLCKLEIEC